MIRYAARLVVGAIVLLGFGLAWALSNNPPVTRTGAPAIGSWPAETTCQSCHTTNPLNDPNGALTIDAPAFYQAGQTYPITVMLRYDLADTTGASNPKWGFQLTAIKASDGAGVGTMITPNSGGSPTYPDSLTIGLITAGPLLGSGRQYMRHTGFATRTDKPSPVQWQFSWQAPGSDQGKVYFFAAGNAANGNSSSSGDFIFTSSDSSLFTTFVPAAGGPSWMIVVGAGLLLSGGFFLALQAQRRRA